MDHGSEMGFARRRARWLLGCLVLLPAVAPSGARAAGGGTPSILLTREEVPAGCKLVDGTFATDVQTAILYDYGAYEKILPAPKAKEHQSFDCGGEKGTLFAFVYANEDERRKVSAFARPVLWGEDHPTPMHPELVVDGGPFLVVVSFRRAPPELVAAVRKKVPAGSGAAKERPTPAGEEMERGSAAYRAGDMAGAERHFRTATRLAPNDIRAFETLGHFLFRTERFGDAIAPYERALQIDDSTRVLDRDERRVLVDQLGTAYGVSGKLEKARALFEEGIRRDPDYPLFHYNLACTYAEMGDPGRAVASLRNALQRRGTMIQGETFPDPRQDSSFRRYLTDDRFRKLLQEYGY